MIKPLDNYVVLSQMKEQRQTQSGIILTVTEKEQPSIGKVLAIGPKVLDIKVGDAVIYQTYSATKVKIGQQEVLVIEAKNIYAVLE